VNPEKIMVPRIGRQRTRRVVMVVMGPTGVAKSERLSCGHTLEPVPEQVRTRRVCPRCEARLGRVTRRLGREATPAEVDLLDNTQHFARMDLGLTKARNVELRQELDAAQKRIAHLVAQLLDAQRRARGGKRKPPPQPEVGQTYHGRVVIAVERLARDIRITWVPAKLYAARTVKQRSGDNVPWEIKRRTSLHEWPALLMGDPCGE
jgi:hypothetical protein